MRVKALFAAAALSVLTVYGKGVTSNIVALARFDAKEAADLGLTNVVDTAEK